jgi:integrase
MKVVQQILGHSSFTVTADIYSHVAPELEAEAMGKLGEALGW